MRKKTGKKTAVFLAAVLAFQTGFSTCAVQAGSHDIAAGMYRAADSRTSLLLSVDTLRDIGNVSATGQVDVSVTAALVLKKQVDFTVTLSGGGSTRTDSLSLLPGSGETGRVSFEGVVPGDYVLTVTGKGFAAFSQNIAVGEQGCEIGRAHV